MDWRFRQSKHSAIEDQKMHAAGVVLGTYELLEGILIYLSPEDITKAMRVATNWHEVVSSSALLHDVRIVAPINKAPINTKWHADRLTDPSSLRPLYDVDSRIHYAKLGVFGKGNVTEPKGNEQLHSLLIGQESSSGALRDPEIQSKYVTRPPCQALAVRSMYEYVQRIVYVKDGVRVQHLKEAANDIWDWSDRYPEGKPKIPPIVVLHFKTAMLSGT